jgi:hypothetical protein
VFLAVCRRHQPPAYLQCVLAPQLGCSFFSTLAEEFSSSDYGHAGVNEFFRPGPDASSPHYVARSVQIDMEPKVGPCHC